MAHQVLDFVDAMMSDAVDYVDRIYGQQHSRYCNYVPSITRNGIIWCDTCLTQTGSIAPDKWRFQFAEKVRGYDPVGPGVKDYEDGVDLLGSEAPPMIRLKREKKKA